ncbi:DNA-directed RNA polymerase subunit beta [Terribacillus halophilus]|uniref:DNA-directed RNA polymerase subunit beta n=1 Tax=Terribacillus halophilus TaxID=361279 RepID=A0A1G6IF35_9BACI|nr:DNA-directed RNA polymerase subunit beta [Terribacillus halophilus]SDC04635.1 DNA-directed RNA polymerase subunit beta [Terribacillus halophilus]
MPSNASKLQTKEQHEKNKQAEGEKAPKKKQRRRLFPIWLRLLVVPLILVIFLMLGMLFGYGVLGDGNALDVLKRDTWTHIYDLINEKS